ncbi:adenylate/guanylate cyclase domain-containing protein [Thalassobaculum sp. OXR-137]|uniref:adenylate/guanylate cyclase domain-containing protein n=1 Tax=Thalassobaculum sp. OXR-137 TaxID=3100173 RepID=UPI002AC95666|nr:adenylate/guanylate cyclase domain-containing protein [Thalassobaculum sp. OXR-137]WPZ34300.1 adenylate/guanylate cyclase domain-containing protein [Thalassobaculum sp. OXR-137]
MADREGREAALRALEDRLVQFALVRADVETIVAAASEVLTGLGVALDEIRVGARTLHPEIDAIAVTWKADEALNSSVFRHADDARETWLKSPLYYMLRRGEQRMHRPLALPECPMDFAVFEELRDEGFTDYLAHLVPIGTPGPERSEGFIIRWLSRDPAGFAAADLALLDRLVSRIVAACEPGRERAIARDLLGAYLGPRSGAAVLSGAVQPGHTESLEAVILVADLSGFTAASDTMPGARLVEFLDRHFDAMIPPIEAEGGEILAFLGDGYLAAFDAAGNPAEACIRGAAAARAIQAGIGAFREEEPAALPVDIALHMGTVRYGNVGAGGRQAFTVIGPAVNLASRIEALCRPLNCPILASADVAAHLPADDIREMGLHPVRGMTIEIPLFSLK